MKNFWRVGGVSLLIVFAGVLSYAIITDKENAALKKESSEEQEALKTAEQEKLATQAELEKSRHKIADLQEEIEKSKKKRVLAQKALEKSEQRLASAQKAVDQAKPQVAGKMLDLLKSIEKSLEDPAKRNSLIIGGIPD